MQIDLEWVLEILKRLDLVKWQSIDDFIVFIFDRKKRIKNEDFFVSTTLVSSPLFEKIAKKNKIECKICQTGFKWIADIIEREKDKKFLCGGEESFDFYMEMKLETRMPQVLIAFL